MTYTITKEQRQQIVDALEYEACCGPTQLNAALDLLRSLPEQSGEPVAWMDSGGDVTNWKPGNNRIHNFRPLYLAVPKPYVLALHHDDPNLKDLPDGTHVILQRSVPKFSEAPQPAAAQEPVAEPKGPKIVFENPPWSAESISLYKAQPAAVPEGYKLVPIEPTEDQLVKGVKAMRLFVTNNSVADFRLGYIAAVQAAQGG